MKSQVTTRYLPSVTVPMIVLCAGAWADPASFDDFREGDNADDSRSTWFLKGAFQCRSASI